MANRAADGGKRPNIVYIMADDMGYGDPGCFGATKIPTPNMDRIARQGIRLTDAHSSAAVCTPSRYSVLTGRYCWRTPLKEWVLWGFEPPLIEPERLTVASMLKAHGYAAGAFGKWHLGLGWSTVDGAPPLEDGWNVDYAAGVTGGPLAVGFDTSYCITGSLDMAPYCFVEDDHVVGILSVEKSPYNPQQRKGLMAPGWRDELVDVTFTEKAVGFIDRQATEHPGQPFLLYLTPSAPHRPCVPPDFIRGASRAGLRGDMVALVDWMVGQIDAALARHGLVEDTLLIVTSDNGARATDFGGNDWGHKANGDLRGQKADIWDGGHREPFVARWPGRIREGGESGALVCLGDLMASCAEIVGHDLGPGMAEDSFSFLHALLGASPNGPQRDDLIHHSGGGVFSIRRDEWKLIAGLGSGGFTDPVHVDPTADGPQGQLYNMVADLQETSNRWLEKPGAVSELTALLNTDLVQGISRAGAG